MTDWLQKMLDGDVSAASSDGYKVGDVVQFLGGPHYKASTDKKANGTPKAGPAKITIIKQGALHPYHVIHTDGTSRVLAGSMPARSPVNLAAVLPAAVKVA